MGMGLGDPSNPFDPAAYGVSGAAPAGATLDTSPGIGRTAISAVDSQFSAENAMRTVAIIIGATFGLIAFSTSGRIGPVKAGVSAGKNP